MPDAPPVGNGPWGRVAEALRERMTPDDVAREFAALLGTDNPLRGRGDERSARCVLHADSNPSLSVNVARGVFYCHGCNARGDLFTLAMACTGRRFPDAVAEYAQRFGVPMPARDPVPASDPEALAERNRRTLDAYTPIEAMPAPVDPDVTEAYHRRLMQQPQLLAVLAERRGLTRETVERLHIGHDGERFTFPVFDAARVCRNVRRYMPGAAEAKMKNLTGHGSPPLLYNVGALDVPGEVWIVEGEPDCALATQHGLNAVTGTGGALTWRDEWSRKFVGCDVVICYDANDADDAGRDGAETVARELYGIAERVRIVTLPAPADRSGYDVTDYLHGDGHTADDLRALADAAPEWTPEPVPLPDEHHNRTDSGNAARVVTILGGFALYTPGQPARVWAGSHWTENDAEARIAHKVRMELPAMIRREADAIADAATPGDREGAKLASALHRWAVQSEGHARQVAALRMAANDPALRCAPDAWDRDRYLFNCPNGTLDLRIGTLRAHDPSDRITRVAAVAYDPAATCPRWDAFLVRMFAGVLAVIAFVQRLAGVSLSGDTSDQLIALLIGTGANGKSVLFDILRALLGPYACVADFSAFAQQAHAGARYDLARLAGARGVFSSEAAEGTKLDEGVLKNLTGGDTVTARKPYEAAREFKPEFTLWLAANHRPVIRGTDLGIWRRMALVSCNVVIPAAEQDPHLKDKLRAELPGILAWAVRGFAAWQAAGGLCPPQAVLAATAEYRSDSDTLGAFLDECCEFGPDYSVGASALFERYTAWAQAARERDLSQRKLARELKDRGLRAVKSNVVRWMGLRLRPVGTEPEPAITGEISEIDRLAARVAEIDAGTVEVR